MRNFSSSIPALAILAGLALGASYGAAEPVQVPDTAPAGHEERVVVVAAKESEPHTQAYTVEDGWIGYGRTEGAVLSAFADTVMLRTGPDDLLRLRTVGGEAARFQPGDHLIVERRMSEEGVPVAQTTRTASGGEAAPADEVADARASTASTSGPAPVARTETQAVSGSDGPAAPEASAREPATTPAYTAGQLPRTASWRALIGLVGLVALASSLGLGLLLRATR